MTSCPVDNEKGHPHKAVLSTSNDLQSAPTAPGRLPLVGHAGALWRNPLSFAVSLREVGDIVRVDVGRYPVYVVTAQHLVQQVLGTQANSFARGRIYDRARALFGNGLATSEGPHHRRQRRLVQPAFHRDQIAHYAEIMSRNAHTLAESWQPGQRVAVDKAMYGLTLDTVVNTLFDNELSPAATAQVHQLMPVIMNGIARRMATPQLFDRRPIPGNRRFDNASRRLRNIVDDIIADYHSVLPDRTDLLALLLAARDSDSDQMTDTQVRDEVISLLMAGAETPGSTLSWVWHELARHPEIERRLHAEVDTVIGPRPVTYDDVAKLEYTRRFLNEVLRLHPVLLFTRRATTHTELGGITIPPGTEVAYSPYALHRDPDLYPHPTRLDPDRWLPDHPAHPGKAFIPFSTGRHKCIGDTYAWTEMTITIATIAARWRLRPDAGHTVREVPAEVPRPNALPMIVSRRPPTTL